ncbi:hypothetical protein G7039_29170 (plasmid) [Rhizobium leguminosarum]|nr:hypothetical protein G7039_29170 [Rhizobium leguminosarum]
MRSTYARAMKQIRMFERGWSNLPRDPGGGAMYGIIQREYDAHRVRKDRAQQTVRNITEDEVAEIYRRQYADKVRYDDLPAGVDFATLDGAINSGVSRGSKWLQGALGIAADGVVGSHTVAAAAKADALKTIKAIIANRIPPWPDHLQHVRKGMALAMRDRGSFLDGTANGAEGHLGEVAQHRDGCRIQRGRIQLQDRQGHGSRLWNCWCRIHIPDRHLESFRAGIHASDRSGRRSRRPGSLPHPPLAHGARWVRNDR